MGDRSVGAAPLGAGHTEPSTGSEAAGHNQRASSNYRASVESALAKRPDGDLPELLSFWGNGSTGRTAGAGVPSDRAQARAVVLGWMLEAPRVARCVGSLGRRLSTVMEQLIAARGYELSLSELAARKPLEYLSEYDLEACIGALERRALIVRVGGNRFERSSVRRLAVPREIGDALVGEAQVKGRGIFDVLTLRGFLDGMYSDPERAARTPASRVRELYKMYASESAAVARFERLPEGVRELLEKAVLEFGGILPRQLFERMDTDLTHWNGRRWALILEQSLVGTVQELDLVRYGIQHNDDTLVVFNEVALAWLRYVGVPSDPDRPDEELSLGIDLFTNTSRFLAFLQEHDVRYTVKGEIFKTTEKKILQHLIPNPGRELSREDVLQFIYSYSKSASLLDGTGERTLSVTSEGRTWGSKPLDEKLQSLVDFAVEEPLEGTEPFHQAHLRRLFLRMLKRVEPGVWYDLMYLPFLARNQYLASLEELGVGEAFEERVHTGSYVPIEDAQRLAWNLVRWARQRLYLMGIIDLGYDDAQRPVALRLTQHGARLLGLSDFDEDSGVGVGNLVVTPDFEVVLFRSGDDAELMHDLDRFGRRERADETVHFRIEQETVRRAMIEGMRLDRILSTLERNSRTPVPQNVTYSIRDWAVLAGRMELSPSLVLQSENVEALERLRQDPGLRNYIDYYDGEHAVQLKGKVTPRRMRALLRDLGYVVELEVV